MSEMQKKFKSQEVEAKLQQYWEENSIYAFSSDNSHPIYAIDTPPPTVSGDLHLGHCYSYSQTDFLARFWRMQGFNVYYPMGWDDNGLPTERLVEDRLGIKPENVGREKFIESIIEVSRKLEVDYEKLWRRLSLSVDWRYTYSTISSESRRVSQYSFIDLYHKGLAYKSSAPTIWCSTCKTAIAQAEVDDTELDTDFITIAFELEDGTTLPIATTRPELLPACVAIFVHPDAPTHKHLIGKTAKTPLFKKEVPILADPKVDPEKGSGIVMCCTFGDSTDVEWWYTYKLPLIAIIASDGKLNNLAGPYADFKITDARREIIVALEDAGLLINRMNTGHTVRVHERCDTPVEYLETKQWFIKVLESKQKFLEAGRSIDWHPTYLHARYEDWVKNLSWDWCISRQRYYGVPFPVWYCANCGKIAIAKLEDLPIDPTQQQPSQQCKCGSQQFIPETDVMDTWATSSVSPQISTKWLSDSELYGRLFPMTLRPQAHDIIRTWAFYTIVKSLYHEGKIPWSNVAISGHGLAPQGRKISKSRGGGPLDPTDMMNKYSADGIRYWSASTRLGRDSIVSEEQMAVGKKLVTKLWNATRFALGFLQVYQLPDESPRLVPVDQWVLSQLHRTVTNVTTGFQNYDYVQAKEETESFFWNVFTDNYLEMVKTRLYELSEGDWRKDSALYTLHWTLLFIIKMFAPLMPYVTEEIFLLHFRQHEGSLSIHRSKWPEAPISWNNDFSDRLGKIVVGIASEIRRYKSSLQMSLGTPLTMLTIASSDQQVLKALHLSIMDIKSVTRSQDVILSSEPTSTTAPVLGLDDIWISIEK